MTIPFKLDALRRGERADDLDAMTVGAANTLRRRGDGWEATNTDVEGFLEPLEEDFPDLSRASAPRCSVPAASARAVIVGLRREARSRRDGARAAEEQAREVAATARRGCRQRGRRLAGRGICW